MPSLGAKHPGVIVSMSEAQRKRAAPPLFPVRHRSRGLKSMHQMNGEHLQSLRRPLCSEFSRRVCGHNAASTSVLKQSTGVWFNETSNFVDRISKKQDQTYKNMLKLFRERKKLEKINKEKEERAALIRKRIRYHQDTSDASIDQMFLEGGQPEVPLSQGRTAECGADPSAPQHPGPAEVFVVVHNSPMSRVTITTSLAEESTPRGHRMTSNIQPTSQKDPPKSKEAQPLTKSDTSSQSMVIALNSQPPTQVTNSLAANAPTAISVSAPTPATLALISDNNAVDRLTVPDVETAASQRRRRNNERASLASKSVSVTMATQGGTGVQTEIRRPPQSAITPPSTPPAIADADAQQPADQPLPSDRDKGQTCSEWMRRRRIHESTRRRKQLDGEPVIVYRKQVDSTTDLQQQQQHPLQQPQRHYMGTGHQDIVATMMSHKRKRFALPSLDDRYMRYRMLKRQEEDRLHQKEKLQEFMSRIRTEEKRYHEEEKQKMAELKASFKARQEARMNPAKDSDSYSYANESMNKIASLYSRNSVFHIEDDEEMRRLRSQRR